VSDAQGSRVGSMFGPYRLKRRLGRGGMGEVYEAEHTVKELPCALKLMSEIFSKDPVFRERMKREARITGRLQEPHVVPIHDYGEIDGQLYLEMRLIDGTDLDSLLKRFGPLTPPRAVAIITQIASALDAAHAASVMHRDVKPPNILVTRDDFAYLVDFGIASATTDEKLTQLGTAVGTWKYMAPERFTNDEVTYRADIYGLACVLYECLTGAPPYRPDSSSMLITAHLMDPIPQPSTMRSGIPKAFDAVIARGMAKKPGDRYASAGDLALAAHEALSDPDQDHAANILRHSQEATLPGTTSTTRRPPPPPSFTTPPTTPVQQRRAAYVDPASPGPSRPIKSRSSQTGQPSWAPHGTPPQPPLGVFASAAAQPPAGPVPTPVPGSGSAATHDHGTASPGPPPGSPPFPVDASLNQRRKRRTKIALITGGVAVIAIAAVVLGVLLWTGSTAGPSSPTSSTPPTVPVAALDGLLLSPEQINSAAGATAMTVKDAETNMADDSANIPDNYCRFSYPAEKSVYAGSPWRFVQRQTLQEPGENPVHQVWQAVVLFPTAKDAAAFFTASAQRWPACSNRQYHYIQTGKPDQVWNAGPIANTNGTLSTTQTQEGSPGFGCNIALTVANNVAVDVVACGNSPADTAVNIAHQIAAKVPT
jgi:serine/threonine kinase PknH